MSLDVLNLLLVLLAAVAGGWVARRFGYPAILGELAAGIVLGPPLLGLLESDDALAVIGKLGVVLLMLAIGLHLDPSDLGNSAKAGALAAAGGFVVPAALGFGLMMLVDGDPLAATYVCVAMGVTSLATKSRILGDLGILNTRVAHVLMSGALFSDIAALIIFAGILGLAATGTLAIGGVAAAVVKAALFLGGTWLIGTRAFPVAGRLLAKHKPDLSMVVLGVVLVGLAFAAAADAAGLHAILGAFLAGLYLREDLLPRGFLVDVERRMRGLSVGLLAPVFFVTAGFQVSFDVFTESPLLLAGVVVLATVGKVVGTAIFYLPTGHGFREGIAVGAGMNGRGAVEIIVAEIALAAGLIDATVFSILVFMAIFTTATVPILLTRAIAWLDRHGELVGEDRDSYVIVGAGPVARRLAASLAETAPVTMIDTNADHCAAARGDGLTAINGSGLDEDVLAEAHAAGAKALLAATANAEVNLLTAKIARRHFGVTDVFVTLGPDTTQSMHSMLDELDGELLFGRPVDVDLWDADLEQDRVVDLEYSIAEPSELLEAKSIDKRQAALTSLPLVIQTPDGYEPYVGDRDLASDDRVEALGRIERNTSIEQPTVAAPD